MKKIFTLIALMACGIAAMAQGLASTPFTAELRDAEGNLMRGTYVGFKYRIDSGDVADAVIERSGYAETDDNGVLTLNLGVDGNATSNNTLANLSEFPFEKVTSSSKNVSLFMSIDPQGGTDYTIFGSSSLSVAVPFAEYSKKAENTNSFGNISLASVNVSIENTAGVSCAVSFAGNNLSSGSATAKVPAYMPMFLTVQLGSYDNVYYEVLINGKNFDNLAGTYLRADKNIQRTFKSDDKSKQYYEYYSVRDNFDGILSGTYNPDTQTKGYGLFNSDPNTNGSDIIPTDSKGIEVNFFEYENPIFVDSKDNKKSIWSQGTDEFLGYESPFYHASTVYSSSMLHDASRLFVKIPVPTLHIDYSVKQTYKVGRHDIDLNADMINQIVGPFSTSKVNTIVIKVKKGTPRQEVY